MKILLDTHVLLWMLSRAERLSETARSLISDQDNELLFSVAAYWEIGIKVSIGKLGLSDDWQETIPTEMARNEIAWLPISPAHIHAVSKLPWMHRDPFDRLLVAQAQTEELTLLTNDAAFSGYDVVVSW